MIRSAITVSQRWGCCHCCHPHGGSSQEFSLEGVWSTRVRSGCCVLEDNILVPTLQAPDAFWVWYGHECALLLGEILLVGGNLWCWGFFIASHKPCECRGQLRLLPPLLPPKRGEGKQSDNFSLKTAFNLVLWKAKLHFCSFVTCWPWGYCEIWLHLHNSFLCFIIRLLLI